MNQHQPRTTTRANRSPGELSPGDLIARIANAIQQARSEEHGRLTREGKARAKARREAEARARAAASDADQVSK